MNKIKYIRGHFPNTKMVETGPAEGLESGQLQNKGICLEPTAVDKNTEKQAMAQRHWVFDRGEKKSKIAGRQEWLYL